MMRNATAVAANAPAIAALQENGVLVAVPVWITSTFSPTMAVSDMDVIRRAQKCSGPGRALEAPGVAPNDPLPRRVPPKADTDPAHVARDRRKTPKVESA